MQLVNTKTGQAEDLGEDQVLPSLAAGTHAPLGAKVLVNPGGELVFSPLEDVHANLNQYGYAVPTQAQLTELANQQKYGEGAGNVAKAALEGTARGATFGLSDILEPKLLGTTAQAISERRSRNPIASTAGEIGGAVGSALLAPEASPAGVLSKLGTGVAEKLAPEALGEGATLAGKILNASGQVGAQAAGSAVEGAAYGLGQTVTEAALGDPDLNAEKIIANVGYGGLFGGALGGLLKSGELAIPASVSKAQEAVQNTYDKLVGKVGESGEFEAGPLTKGIAKAGSFATGQPEEEILEHAKKVMSGEGEVLSNPQRRVFYREFNDALENHYKAVNKASLDASTLVRPQESAALLEGMDPAAAAVEHANVKGVLEHHIAEMEASPDLYPARFPAKLRQVADGLDSGVAPEGGSAHDYFSAIENAKKALDAKIPWNKEISGEAADAVELLKGVRSELKNSLEKEDVWGEAGARTAAYNDSVNDFLAAKKQFQTAFMQKVPTKSGGVTYRLNPTKTNSFFNMINDPRGDVKNDVLKNFFRSSKNMVDEIDKTYQSAAFEKFDKETMQGLIEKNEGMASRATGILQNQPGGFGAVTDMFSAAMAATGNPLGMLGLAAKTVMDPHTTINRLTNLERAAQQSSSAIIDASRAVFNPSSGVTKKTIGPVAGELSVAAQKDQFEKRSAEIQDYNTAPAKTINKLELVTRDMYHVAPKISSSVQMAALRGNQFLASKIPKAPGPQLPFDRPFKPSASEMIKFDKYYQMVHRPLSALSELKSGRVSPETVETLQAVYPSLYSEMKTEVLNSMTSAIAKEQTVPYQKRLAISAFLGQPLDSSMLPPQIQANQMVLSQQAAAKSAQESPVKSTAKGIGNISLSDRLKTNIQDTAQRERA